MIYKKYFPAHNKQNCLKISYKYKNVDVNLFFDFYDSDCANFFITLLYEEDYYFTPLNINKLDNNEKWFLNKIPQKILKKIMVNTKLDLFCQNLKEHVENHIKNEQILKCNYNDKDFKKSLKFTQNEIENKPFLSHIRNVRMSEKQFKKNLTHFDIPYNTLKYLQRKNRTIITTCDPSKRKTLTIILQEINI